MSALAIMLAVVSVGAVTATASNLDSYFTFVTVAGSAKITPERLKQNATYAYAKCITGSGFHAQLWKGGTNCNDWYDNYCGPGQGGQFVSNNAYERFGQCYVNMRCISQSGGETYMCWSSDSVGGPN